MTGTIPREGAASVQRGTVIAGRYRLARPISSGPRTTLWRAVDEVLARPVAVKVLDGVPGDDPAAVAFLDAAARAGAVLHPGLVRVDDAAVAVTPGGGSVAYVVTEWLQGLPLGGLLRDGPLDVDDAVSVVRDCAAALAAAHAAGVPHGALHPGQVVVDADLTVTVTDLAVAAVVAPAVPGRRSPGRPPSDRAVAAAPRTPTHDDARALGAVLYAALTARWPDGERHGLPAAPRVDGRAAAPRQVRAGVPRHLDSLVVQAMEPRRPGEAPLDTPARVERALRAAPTTRAAPRRPRRGVPRWLTGATTAAVLVGALGLVGVTTYSLGLAIGTVPEPEERLPGLPVPAAAPTAVGPAPTAPQPVPITGVVDFDPEGDGREQPTLARLAVDADPSATSSWQTSRYASATLGGLKTGVGLVLDLGQTRAVRSVTVQTALPGASVELRAAGGTPPATITGTRVVAAAASLTPTTLLSVPAGTSSRYWVLWLTRLPEVPGGFRGSVSEVLFRA